MEENEKKSLQKATLAGYDWKKKIKYERRKKKFFSFFLMKKCIGEKYYHRRNSRSGRNNLCSA